jgi:hypothetical protein
MAHGFYVIRRLRVLYIIRLYLKNSAFWIGYFREYPVYIHFSF